MAVRDLGTELCSQTGRPGFRTLGSEKGTRSSARETFYLERFQNYGKVVKVDGGFSV